jgi:hypothetical protein
MTKVPPGISGRPPTFNSADVTLETLANEVALLSLGDFEPLDYKINLNDFNNDIAKFKDDWVDYLPRTDRPNNRKGLSLTNYPGWPHNYSPSLAEAVMKLEHLPKETDFNERTKLYHECPSLNFLEEWQPLGRTFLVKSDIGGYFVPHRDHPSIPRETFRLIAFLNNCGPTDYDWIMNEHKVSIEPGRVYYVNTRKTHRTISWVNDSIHLILNVPFTSVNVSRVLTHLLHRH